VISSSTFINSNAKKGDAVYSNYDVLVVDSKKAVPRMQSMVE
jgi:hypothetical protein